MRAGWKLDQSARHAGRVRIGDEAAAPVGATHDALHPKLRRHRFPKQHGAGQKITEDLRCATRAVLRLNCSAHRIRRAHGDHAECAVVGDRAQDAVVFSQHAIPSSVALARQPGHPRMSRSSAGLLFVLRVIRAEVVRDAVFLIEPVAEVDRLAAARTERPEGMVVRNLVENGLADWADDSHQGTSNSLV